MKIILYDGDCMLCNSFISFVLRQQKPEIYFCDLHSGTGRLLLVKHNLPVHDFSTIYFLDDEVVFSKSTAIIKILENLSKQYTVLAHIMAFMPGPIRDFVYALIAKNRFRLWKKKSCLLPNSIQRKQILG